MNTTKQNMAEALKRVLLKRPLTKVTIGDITRECGVTRMTFYYHFTDIYDLLQWVCNHDISLALVDYRKNEEWQQGFLAILETVRGNKTFVMNICRSVDRRQVESYLYATADELLREAIEHNAHDIALNDSDKQIAVDFYKYAVVGMGMEWVDNDMQTPPQVIVVNTSRMVQGDFRQPLEWLSHNSFSIA